METFKRAVPVVSHLILVAVLVLVWEKAPDAVRDLITERLKATPSAAVLSTLEYIVTIILLVVIVFIFERVSSLRVWASLSRDDLLKTFEGEWVQQISLAERPFSIGLIRFDAASERWEYNGVGFGKDLRPAATWHSSSLRYDRPEHAWYFAGTARLLDEQNKDARYTVVPILHLPQGASDQLTGTVADIGAGGQRTIFDIRVMKRIPKALGAGKLSTPDTIRSLSKDEVQRILTDAKLPV